MGVKVDNVDNLGKMFEEFAFDPFGDEIAKREAANLAEAEKFLQNEEMQIKRKEREEKKK